LRGYWRESYVSQFFCHADFQKPEIEPLDAFVASLTDKELARQLIIDSKPTLLLIEILTIFLDLPEIFLQISNPENPEQYRVVTGLCILVRSPAFHPYFPYFAFPLIVKEEMSEL